MPPPPLTPRQARAALDLIEEMELMADVTDADIAEIERLGREHPLTDEERERLHSKIRAVLDRARAGGAA